MVSMVYVIEDVVKVFSNVNRMRRCGEAKQGDVSMRTISDLEFNNIFL